MSLMATLEVSLHGVVAGYLTRYPDARCTFVVDAAYSGLGEGRPMLSLSMARPGDEAATRALLRDERHKSAQGRLPPFFANLLPQGEARSFIAQGLDVREGDAFALLSALGADLPGGLVLRPLDGLAAPPPRKALPPQGVASRDANQAHGQGPALRFALPGEHMKFSMQRQGGRFAIADDGQLGDFIVKPPGRHDGLAHNLIEAAGMETARAVGIDVPQARLIPTSGIAGWPELPGLGGGQQGDEPFLAIPRFDRGPSGGRIHTENFAQVFQLWPGQGHGQVNHEMIARTLLLYGGGLPELKEMARRLVLGVLMGHGEAGLRSWSLIHDNPARPRLAPACDLVSTIALEGDEGREAVLPLNMGGIWRCEQVTLATFRRMFERVGLVDYALAQVVAQAHATGQQVLDEWEAAYRRTGVPEKAIGRVKAHQKALALVPELMRR